MKNLVIFKASWCQPCKALSKTLSEIELGIPVRSIDIDEDMEAAKEYAVRGVPTLLLIEDNQVVKRVSGSLNHKQLLDFIS